VNVFFRVDSSFQIGTGHLVRCLSLAEAMKQKGAKISFFCRNLKGSLVAQIEARGMRLHLLPETENIEDVRMALKTENIPGDAWIVDHYGLDAEWESAMRSTVKKILVIDDMADRKHDCDLLVDQNFYRDSEQRYRQLVSRQCISLLGPKYALLNAEFQAASPRARESSSVS
jgi:UDP-2,4-diacetamido-2,4,6-trideoxy-beta-L-altropyranose hydrolase